MKYLLVLLFLFIPVIGNCATDFTADANCMGAWLMDVDEDPITDSSGEGHTGALLSAGNPNFIASAKYGGGYDFDGADDIISCGDIAELDATTELSIVCWVYHDDLDDDDLLISKMNGLADGWQLFRDDNNAGVGRTETYRIYFEESGTTDTADLTSATDASPATTWTHVAFTMDADSATGLRLYVNGVEDANSPVSSEAVETLDAGVYSLTLGEEAGYSRPLDGRLDEVAVFTRILSLVEINAIMDDGLDGTQAAVTGAVPQIIMY